MPLRLEAARKRGVAQAQERRGHRGDYQPSRKQAGLHRARGKGRLIDLTKRGNSSDLPETKGEQTGMNVGESTVPHPGNKGGKRAGTKRNKSEGNKSKSVRMSTRGRKEFSNTEKRCKLWQFQRSSYSRTLFHLSRGGRPQRRQHRRRSRRQRRQVINARRKSRGKKLRYADKAVERQLERKRYEESPLKQGGLQDHDPADSKNWSFAQRRAYQHSEPSQKKKKKQT